MLTKLFELKTFGSATLTVAIFFTKAHQNEDMNQIAAVMQNT